MGADGHSFFEVWTSLLTLGTSVTRSRELDELLDVVIGTITARWPDVMGDHGATG